MRLSVPQQRKLYSRKAGCKWCPDLQYERRLYRRLFLWLFVSSSAGTHSLPAIDLPAQQMKIHVPFERRCVAQAVLGIGAFDDQVQILTRPHGNACPTNLKKNVVRTCGVVYPNRIAPVPLARRFPDFHTRVIQAGDDAWQAKRQAITRFAEHARASSSIRQRVLACVPEFIPFFSKAMVGIGDMHAQLTASQSTEEHQRKGVQVREVKGPFPDDDRFEVRHVTLTTVSMRPSAWLSVLLAATRRTDKNVRITKL